MLRKVGDFLLRRFFTQNLSHTPSLKEVVVTPLDASISGWKINTQRIKDNTLNNVQDECHAVFQDHCSLWNVDLSYVYHGLR